MPKQDPLQNRKSDHIEINLNQDVKSSLSNGLDKYRFIHNALPDVNLTNIDMSQSLFGKRLKKPIIISSMTGGTDQAQKINATLAQAAQETGVAMGLGSQRAMIENAELSKTFQVRQYAPDILLFANLGAVQLNYGYGIIECIKAVEQVQADALILHLNPLQEALQPEGEADFSGLTKKISEICNTLSVPVIVKEVGWGISADFASRLRDCGVAVIDVAGAGGTSWSQVEMHRNIDPDQKAVAATFREWGIPTAESILMVKEGAPGMTIFASGGLRNGLDIAKCIALGASAGGMAGVFLRSAVVSVEQTVRTILRISKEIQVSMFSAGAVTLEELQKIKLLRESSI